MDVISCSIDHTSINPNPHKSQAAECHIHVGGLNACFIETSMYFTRFEVSNIIVHMNNDLKTLPWWVRVYLIYGSCT